MFGKIKEIEDRYDEIEKNLASPEIIQDQKAYQRYMKEHSSLAPVITAFRKYKSHQEEIENNETLLDVGIFML